MREEAAQATGALHVMLKNQSIPIEYAVAAGLDADTSRKERERRIVEDLIARDNRYRDRAREMAALVLNAKDFALSERTPEEILELIEKEIEPRARPDEQEPTPSPAALGALERSATTAVSSDK
jgi:hypothetical protein